MRALPTIPVKASIPKIATTGGRRCEWAPLDEEGAASASRLWCRGRNGIHPSTVACHVPGTEGRNVPDKWSSRSAETAANSAPSATDRATAAVNAPSRLAAKSPSVAEAASQSKTNLMILAKILFQNY